MSQDERPVPWPNAPTHRLSNKGTYFVTVSTLYKQHLFRTPLQLDVSCRGLLTVTKEFGWDLEAWAVFSNHYHFVGHCLSDPESLEPLTCKLHSKLGIWVNKRDRTPGRDVFHNYWDTQLTHQPSYITRLAYVHRNAVHHGLVQEPAQYPWCSAGWMERVCSNARIRKTYTMGISKVSIKDDFEPVTVDCAGSGLKLPPRGEPMTGVEKAEYFASRAAASRRTPGPSAPEK